MGGGRGGGGELLSTPCLRVRFKKCLKIKPLEKGFESVNIIKNCSHVQSVFSRNIQITEAFSNFTKLHIQLLIIKSSIFLNFL
jgi:hypothetical protein